MTVVGSRVAARQEMREEVEEGSPDWAATVALYP